MMKRLDFGAKGFDTKMGSELTRVSWIHIVGKVAQQLDMQELRNLFSGFSTKKGK